MTATDAVPDFDELRGRVRASQHARSVPLLVIGGLLANYSVTNFAATPIQWRYAAPLAFVLIWAFGKVNETAVGVRTGRADYLVAAGAVFIATNLLLMFRRFVAGGSIYFFQLTGAWIAIVGLALIAIAWSIRDRVLVTAGAAVTAAGAALFAVHPANEFVPGFGFLGAQRTWQMTLVAALGALLGVTGLLLYRRERTDG
jgi:drug/metabolite transporter superfamily protein YnfA